MSTWNLNFSDPLKKEYSRGVLKPFVNTISHWYGFTLLVSSGNDVVPEELVYSQATGKEVTFFISTLYFRDTDGPLGTDY